MPTKKTTPPQKTEVVAMIAAPVVKEPHFDSPAERENWLLRYDFATFNRRDIRHSYQAALEKRLDLNLPYLKSQVDEMDLQILMDAVDLMKRLHGSNDDDILQPGDLLKAIHFVLDGHHLTPGAAAAPGVTAH